MKNEQSEVPDAVGFHVEAPVRDGRRIRDAERGERWGGQAHGVCYSIEGHIVDRETGQNGRGWAEGYAHTLNATDRHAVCFRRSEHEEENRRHG